MENAKAVTKADIGSQWRFGQGYGCIHGEREFTLVSVTGFTTTLVHPSGAICTKGTLLGNVAERLGPQTPEARPVPSRKQAGPSEKATEALCSEWNAGARDFPRSPGPSVPAQEAPTVAAVKPALSMKEADDAVIARLRGENTRLREEVAALRQPFRRKPKPEPWQPSIDEFDLLPDQGTSWSGL